MLCVAVNRVEHKKKGGFVYVFLLITKRGVMAVIEVKSGNDLLLPNELSIEFESIQNSVRDK